MRRWAPAAVLNAMTPTRVDDGDQAELGERQSAENGGDRHAGRGETPRDITRDHDRALAPELDVRADREGGQRDGHGGDGGEDRHLGGRRVDDGHRDDRQGDLADAGADLADRQSGPQAPEVRVATRADVLHDTPVRRPIPVHVWKQFVGGFLTAHRVTER